MSFEQIPATENQEPVRPEGVERVRAEILGRSLNRVENPARDLFIFLSDPEILATATYATWQDAKDERNYAEARSLLGYEETVKVSSYDPELARVCPPEDVAEFVEEHFGERRLRQALVGQIVLDTQTTIMSFETGNSFGLSPGTYLVPDQQLASLLDGVQHGERGALIERCFRAYSVAAWRRMEGLPMSGRYFISPIMLFSQRFSSRHISGLPYLADADSEDDRLRRYALGHISHEIAHAMWSNQVAGSEWEVSWKEAVDQAGGVTDYASSYDTESDRDYDEQFAEAMRLRTTAPAYFAGQFPEIAETLDGIMVRLASE